MSPNPKLVRCELFHHFSRLLSQRQSDIQSGSAAWRSARKAPKIHPSTVICELGVTLVRRVTFTNSQLLLLHFRGDLLHLSLFSVKHILFQSWMSGRDVVRRPTHLLVRPSVYEGKPIIKTSWCKERAASTAHVKWRIN